MGRFSAPESELAPLLELVPVPIGCFLLVRISVTLGTANAFHDLISRGISQPLIVITPFPTPLVMLRRRELLDDRS
jgi:hypothetical protein